jgi:hypothetical protein
MKKVPFMAWQLDPDVFLEYQGQLFNAIATENVCDIATPH